MKQNNLKEYASFLPTWLDNGKLDIKSLAILGKIYQVSLSVGKKDNFYLTDREINKDLGLDFKSISRHRKLLIDRKYIIFHKGHRGTASRYEILFDGNSQHNASTNMNNNEQIELLKKEIEEMRQEIQQLKDFINGDFGEKCQHNASITYNI